MKSSKIFFCLLALSFGASAFAQTGGEKPADTPPAAASTPSVSDTLVFKPSQPDVNIDTPSPDEIPGCTVEFAPGNKGWVVKDAKGATLRILMSTKPPLPGRRAYVDQRSFFKGGFEVYRDFDNNQNGKIDMCHWYHFGGSRCGVDSDEDGVIDQWIAISPEEVASEIIAAIAANDESRFLRVAVSRENLAALGKSLGTQLGKAVESLPQGFKDAVATLKVAPDAEWIVSRSSRPGMIPAGQSGNTEDLTIYEDVVVLFREGGKDEKAIDRTISIGTLVKIGENNWRVLNAPAVYEEDTARYTFFPPFGMPSQGNVPGATQTSEAQTQLIKNVQDKQKLLHDPKSGLTDVQKKQYYDDITKQILQIIPQCSNSDDKGTWVRMGVENVLEATQNGMIIDTSARLKQFEDTALALRSPELTGFVQYRIIMNDYYSDVMNDKLDKEEVQKKWVKKLETLIEQYGKTLAGAEATMQLANHWEMMRETEKAQALYSTVNQSSSKEVEAAFGKKAEGAVRRITSVGKIVPFTGKDSVSGTAIDVAQFKDQFVVLYFWASWSDDTNTEYDALIALSKKYDPKVVRIIGINLDTDKNDMAGFLKTYPMPFPQIHDPGGMDSMSANYWGIQAPPTIILYGKDGKVAAQNIDSVETLGRKIETLLAP